MITISKEDYLKAILEAESEGETVISPTLAKRLSVSPPAVSMALRRLKRDGLVEVRKDMRVLLNRQGRSVRGLGANWSVLALDEALTRRCSSVSLRS